MLTAAGGVSEGAVYRPSLEAAVIAPDAEPSPPGVGVTPDRIIAASPVARAIHRLILRDFATTGGPPTTATLTIAAGHHDLRAALAELHDQDIICLDDTGAIRAAYPFSARPTPHRVDIADGPTVYAMCAIDALGIADMLDRDVVIRSADPGTGQPVTVTIRNGRPAWAPGTTVVYVGGLTDASRPDTSCGATTSATTSATTRATTPAADRCCTVMNFFADRSSAARWQAEHTEVSGVVLDQESALRRAASIFGHLLKG
jgi:hypothetical protein